MADRKKTELNEEQISLFLQEIVGKIRTEEDPLELNLYRRLFRKHVPFHLRSYFAAYLLKQINTGKAPTRLVPFARSERSSRGGRNERSERGERTERNERSDRGDRAERGDRNERTERKDRTDRSDRGEGRGNRAEGRTDESRRSRQGEPRAQESRQAESARTEPRPSLPDDVSTTLFVSIGRNRRVYPRDLIGLIMQNVEMDREHIGDIRVLDNYSFVQVITEDAEKIISALNEFEYRGRKLAVSYSRKREETADSAADSATDMAGIGAEAVPGTDLEEGSAYESADDGSVDDSDPGAGPDAGSWSDSAESDLPDEEKDNGDI